LQSPPSLFGQRRDGLAGVRPEEEHRLNSVIADAGVDAVDFLDPGFDRLTANFGGEGWRGRAGGRGRRVGGGGGGGGRRICLGGGRGSGLRLARWLLAFDG